LLKLTTIGFSFLPPTDCEHHGLIQVDQKQLVPLYDIYIGFPGLQSLCGKSRCKHHFEKCRL